MKKKAKGKQSGLSIESLLKYAGNPLLERDGGQNPIYMHRANCTTDCKWSCNGTKGWNIAIDVDAIEKQSRHP